MPFIGNQPAEAFSSFQKQDFTTSATTSYTLENIKTDLLVGFFGFNKWQKSCYRLKLVEMANKI